MHNDSHANLRPSLKKLLEELVKVASVTPHDHGCQEILIKWLEERGFLCQRFDNLPVSNFFARIGEQSPLLIFAGHTDIVPAGELSEWHTPPFELTEIEGKWYGRGVADMKGSLAAMMIMADAFVKNHPDFTGSLGFLITSGEEGDDFDLGTPYVMEKLHAQGILPQFCVVGEPSSTKYIGDVIKIGRRGSLTGRVMITGKQGHVAYPHLADNPIHRGAPVLAALVETIWDHGNDFFPPTSFQITSIKVSDVAGNMIPGHMSLQFNFRFSTEQTAEKLKEKVSECFNAHSLLSEIRWQLNGEPFLTSKGLLLEKCQEAIYSITGQLPLLSTDGGTSDGRFIAPYGVEVIELGPCNESIHKVNESVSIAELETLSKIYYTLCMLLLGS